MPNFVRPRPVAWFFFLLALALTVGAGTWQVERLQWKRGLIDELATANEQAPLEALPTTDFAPLQFRKVHLHGTWIDTEFHVTPRYLNNQFGYAIITPLKLADGRVVLVNRGWVPAAKKDAASRPETRVHGKATVTGLIRTDRDRSSFTPVSQPEKNVWFARDIDQMAAFAKLDKVVPVMVDIVGEAPASAPQKTPVAQSLPIPSDGTIRLRNDHLSYIITWYGIALGILVIFITYHRKKK